MKEINPATERSIRTYIQPNKFNKNEMLMHLFLQNKKSPYHWIWNTPSSFSKLFRSLPYSKCSPTVAWLVTARFHTFLEWLLHHFVSSPAYSKWFMYNKDSNSPLLLFRWHRVWLFHQPESVFKIAGVFEPHRILVPVSSFCSQKPRVQPARSWWIITW